MVRILRDVVISAINNIVIKMAVCKMRIYDASGVRRRRCMVQICMMMMVVVVVLAATCCLVGLAID